MHSSGYWVWRWLGRSVGPTLGSPWRRGSDFRRARIGSCALDRHMSMKKAWDIMHGASSFNQSKLGWICSTKIMKRARSSTIHMYSYTSLIHCESDCCLKNRYWFLRFRFGSAHNLERVRAPNQSDAKCLQGLKSECSITFPDSTPPQKEQPDKINISLVYRTCTLSDLEAAFFWRATEKWKEKRPYQIVDR